MAPPSEGICHRMHQHAVPSARWKTHSKSSHLETGSAKKHQVDNKQEAESHAIDMQEVTHNTQQGLLTNRWITKWAKFGRFNKKN